MKWYKGAPPMDGSRYLLRFKGSTDSDDIICTGSYRYGRPCNEPAPNTKAWRCDCCGKFSDPYYWAEIPKRPDEQVNTAIRTAEVDGERYCHSEYGSENCKWEPGIGCTPKCPECIP